MREAGGLSGMDDAQGISCGQCHSGLGAKPVEAMVRSGDVYLNNPNDLSSQLQILFLFAVEELQIG